MSLAISAQGSKIEIATGTGGAKTITAISKANPCQITSAAHGLSAGDVVALAAIGGMTELNGINAVISHVTTNTFALENVDSTGYTTYTSGGTATPVTYTEIAEVNSFSPPEASASEVDVTHLKSTSKEFLLGLVDNGEISLDMNYVENDPGQQAMIASNIAATKKSYKITLPNATVFSFEAFCKGISAIPKAGVDSKLTRSAKLRVTGDVTEA